MKNINTHLPLESLACVNNECELYGQIGKNNLTIRKQYGKDNHIRYLKCSSCQREFSERKNTPLFNSKIPEEKAISIAEHLSEGCSTQSTARLVKVDRSTVRRLGQQLGKHGQQFHDQHVQDVEVSSLQADERHGFVGDKKQQHWEAELIDPKSKFILSHVQGRRDTQLIRRLLTDGVARLKDRHNIALFTDGFFAYRRLFPQLFGVPYQPKRRGPTGRYPKKAYRIPRTLVHVQLIKYHAGRRLRSSKIKIAHGWSHRLRQTLDSLGYQVPNTSAIERRNATSRLMSSVQVRRTLAFAKRGDRKEALGWWATTVYNWCRPNRSLRCALLHPVGKKSINNEHLLWFWV